MKYIHFSFVDSSLLKEFFLELDLSKINHELFMTLKASLIESKEKIDFTSRWKNPVYHLSEEETNLF
jgi:hypothetical protein